MKHSDQVRAYREAGYCPNSSPKTQTENACRFFKRTNVIARLAEIKAALADKNQVTLESLNETLLRVVSECEGEGKHTPIIQAVAQLARMNGHESAKKIQQTTSMDISIEDDLTEQQRENLKKLL